MHPQLINKVSTRVLLGSATLDRLIAAGPITVQPDSRPYRVVTIVRDDSKFVVYREYFEDMNILHGSIKDICVHKSFLEGGFYFDPDNLIGAMKRFAENLANNANNFYGSLYRETPVQSVESTAAQ